MTTQLEGQAALSKQVSVQSLQSNRLSHFRTDHVFSHYGEFCSPQEFLALRDWAAQRRLPMLILGNGSNVLFCKRQIDSLVLSNRLPETMQAISERALEVSSTVSIAQVLKWCKERQLDSFYYLASVPATIGGAIAMNAGRGRAHNKSIFDFVRSVTFLDGDCERTLGRDEIAVSYRQTPFTGQTSKLILRAVLEFPSLDVQADHARERVLWSKACQDHSAPNCGSVFKQHDARIVRFLKGKRLGSAAYSAKTSNWLLSTGRSSRPLVWLIRLGQLLHLLVCKRARVELICVK